MEENFIESEIGETELGHVGFNGRWNKKADTCYCWWVGGTLEVCLKSITELMELTTDDIVRCSETLPSSMPRHLGDTSSTSRSTALEASPRPWAGRQTCTTRTSD